MKIDSAGLERFRLESRLGEGADLEVYAATDTESGDAVVVKRPHPSIVSRSGHREVERRIEWAIGIREQLGDSLNHVARLIAYTESEPHDGYFGDSLGESYTVLVEERAKGLPLVGSAIDGIRRKPIGLPQNLFALHPVVPHSERGVFTILRDVLDVAEAFYNAGVLLLDLRPQNVYFDPRDANITVIDASSVAEERPETRRRPALDLHDFYLEMFKWYIAPSGPPSAPAEYGEPFGMGSVTMFAQDLDVMLEEYSATSQEPLKSTATDILQKIRERRYRDFQDFRADFEPYLSLLEERYGRFYESEEVVSVWMQASSLLDDPYWRKFLFDAREDLTPYSNR